MLIQISSSNDPRKVRIEDDDGAVHEFSAANLKEAHRLIKEGRAEGWVKPKADKPKPANNAVKGGDAKSSVNKGK